MNKGIQNVVWKSLKSTIVTGLALLTLGYGAVSYAIVVDTGTGTNDPTNGNTAPIAPIPTFERTGNSVKVKIKDSSNYENGYRIQRRNANYTWTTIGNVGALSPNVIYSRTQYGLQPETIYCFRSQAYNQHGTRNSAVRCAYTTDGQENKVWRVQVELTTSHVSYADTDDGIWVRLNTASGSYEPHGNFTWMDYATDDFEKNQVKKFDLNLSGISDMSDINRIYFGKSGSDGWCMKQVKLIVNEVNVFEKSFNNEPSGCHWMDNDNGHSNYFYIGRNEIRNHPNWIGYNQDGALWLLSAFGITSEDMEDRIEGIVGHMMHDEPLYWGFIYGEAVSITDACPGANTNCNKVHVDLDMGAKPSILGIPLPNLSVDVDFDLNFQCNGGNLNIWTSNFSTNADYNWLLEILSLGLLNLVDSEVESAVKYGWKAIEQSVSGLPECHVYVDDANTIRLEAVE